MQLTVRDAARILAVPERKIHHWIRHEGLPAYRVQAQYRLNRAEVLEWALSRRLPVTADLFAGPGQDASPLPALSEALAAGGEPLRIGGGDKAAVLRAVVDALRLPPALDREFLYRVLLAREALGSTAVGDGIAIPHVRNPVVLQAAAAALHLCHLETPIDFDAPDGRPVHLLFLALSPTVRTHLHLLSRLAFALRDAGFKAAVLRRAPAAEVLAEARRLEAAAPPAAPPGAGEPPA